MCLLEFIELSCVETVTTRYGCIKFGWLILKAIKTKRDKESKKKEQNKQNRKCLQKNLRFLNRELYTFQVERTSSTEWKSCELITTFAIVSYVILNFMSLLAKNFLEKQSFVVFFSLALPITP